MHARIMTLELLRGLLDFKRFGLGGLIRLGHGIKNNSSATAGMADHGVARAENFPKYCSHCGRDLTCLNAGTVSKSNIEGMLRPLTACSMLAF